MAIHILPSFVEDLKSHDDHRLVKRALEQINLKQQDLGSSANDHRYKGIDGAWIRYLSAGKSAYRLIYIRRGGDIYLYRAGNHDIEDRLSQPRFDGVVSLDAASPKFNCLQAGNSRGVDVGELLHTTEPIKVWQAITRMFHIGHKEIWLVSPFLSLNLLARRGVIGRFLDRAIEENTVVVLVTRPPSTVEELKEFEDMDRRGFICYFHQKLHSKLYLFEIEPNSLSKYNHHQGNVAIIGSSNLTDSGLSINDYSGNEELCYELPNIQFANAKRYANKLTMSSDDWPKAKMNFFRRK